LCENRFGVGDALLYVMLRWAQMIEMDVPPPLIAFRDAAESRLAVQQALAEEGLA
jgi:glutathione S-transferase